MFLIVWRIDYVLYLDSDVLEFSEFIRLAFKIWHPIHNKKQTVQESVSDRWESQENNNILMTFDYDVSLISLNNVWIGNLPLFYHVHRVVSRNTSAFRRVRMMPANRPVPPTVAASLNQMNTSGHTVTDVPAIAGGHGLPGNRGGIRPRHRPVNNNYLSKKESRRLGTPFADIEQRSRSVFVPGPRFCCVDWR